MKIQTSVRVDEEFYQEAKKVFKKVGLTFGDAVNLFLSKVSMEQGIPFSINIAENDKAYNSYPAISKEEARDRVAKAVEAVKKSEAILLTQEAYDDNMNEFMKTL